VGDCLPRNTGRYKVVAGEQVDTKLAVTAKP